MSPGPGIYPPGSEIVRGATFSEDGLYRYALARRWGPGPSVTFVMLNPSVGNGTHDDATIRRCVGFAVRERLNAIRVVNLYAFVATKPPVMFAAQADGVNVVGPDNDGWLKRTALDAALTDSPLIAAWGVNARPDRVEEVLPLLGPRLQSFGTTKDGHPRHPLMLSGAAQLAVWP